MDKLCMARLRSIMLLVAGAVLIAMAVRFWLVIERRIEVPLDAGIGEYKQPFRHMRILAGKNYLKLIPSTPLENFSAKVKFLESLDGSVRIVAGEGGFQFETRLNDFNLASRTIIDIPSLPSGDYELIVLVEKEEPIASPRLARVVFGVVNYEIYALFTFIPLLAGAVIAAAGMIRLWRLRKEARPPVAAAPRSDKGFQ